jgi:hypothetical protein
MMGGHRIAQHPTREQILRRREIERSLLGVNLRHVPAPQHIRRDRGEHAPNQVSRNSHLAVGQVRSRDREPVNARIPLAWNSDHHADWMTKVPSWSVNVLPDRHRPRGSWRAVSGDRALDPVLCDSSNADLLTGALPHRRGRFCKTMHAIWCPVHDRVVDDMVERFATDEIVRLDLTCVIDGRHQTGVQLRSPHWTSSATRPRKSATKPSTSCVELSANPETELAVSDPR